MFSDVNPFSWEQFCDLHMKEVREVQGVTSCDDIVLEKKNDLIKNM